MPGTTAFGAVPAVAVLYMTIPATWLASGLALLVAVNAIRGIKKPLFALSISKIDDGLIDVGFSPILTWALDKPKKSIATIKRRAFLLNKFFMNL
jgi:hypothetical protein